MQRLLETMRTLRAPDGCPWDREQTHLSLRPYLLEEAAEAVDAISDQDAAETVNELGDVLLQVAFHSVIAEEAGEWRYSDVETAIVDKLVRRHPHVFGDTTVADASEVTRNWNSIKAGEGSPVKTGAARLPSGLGALARESEAQKKLEEPTGSKAAALSALESASEDAAGIQAALSALVRWARSLKLDSEVLLREHTNARLNAEP